MFAGLDGSAIGEGFPIHRPFVGWLNHQELDGLGIATGYQTEVGVDDGARSFLGSLVGRFRVVDLDVLVAKSDGDAWPGVEAVDSGVNEVCGLVEIDDAVGFGHLRGDGDLGWVLGEVVLGACKSVVEDFGDQVWAVV